MSEIETTIEAVETSEDYGRFVIEHGVGESTAGLGVKYLDLR